MWRDIYHRFDVFSAYSVSTGEFVLAVAGGIALGLAAWGRTSDAVSSCMGAVLGLVMALICLIDRRMFIIPDALSLSATAAGLAGAGLAGPEAGFERLAGHVLAAVLAACLFMAIRVFYRRWRGSEGLGLGDVKLAAAAGAWVGLDWLGLTLLLACGAALTAVMLSALAGKPMTRSTALPFGSFIAPAIALAWLGQMWLA